MKLKWVGLDVAKQVVFRWEVRIRGGGWVSKWVEIILELEPGS